jgi:hypothetical protein
MISLKTQIFQTLLSFACWAYFLAVFIVKGKKQALYVLTTVGILTFDQSSFVFEDKGTNLVNFFALPFLGIYPFVLVSILFFVDSMRQIYISFKSKQNSLPQLTLRFIKYIVVFIIIGIITGVLLSFMNGLNAEAFKYDLTRFLLVLLYIPIFGYFINDEEVAYKYEHLIFNFLISSGIITLYSIVSGNVGHYGLEREIVPLIPLYAVFSTALVSFLVTNASKNKLLYLFSLLNIALTILYGNTLGGKAWVIMVLSLLYVAQSYIRKVYGVIITIALSFVLVNMDAYNIANNDSVSGVKYDEFISAINIFDPNWYASMSGSPKFRIDEFMNVFIEYQENPILALFGKGVGGWVSDHTSTFGWLNEAAFDDSQYIKGQYYSLHESVNVIFLKFGIVGLMVFLFLFYKLIRVSLRSKNPHIFIGAIWLLFFVSYSYELMFFGVPCLMVGLFYSKEKYVLNTY